MDYLPEIEDNFKRHFSKIKKTFGIKNDVTCDMPYVILNFKLKSVYWWIIIVFGFLNLWLYFYLCNNFVFKNDIVSNWTNKKRIIKGLKGKQK